MDFSTARILGLIGSILIIIFPLAGIILLLISLYFFSKIYAEPRIFRYALISIVVPIVGAIAVIPLLILLGVALEVASVSEGDALSEASIATIILEIVLASIFVVLAVAPAFFWYRALNTLSRVSGEGLFRLAGLLAVISILLLEISLIISMELVGLAFIFFFFGVIALLASFIVLAAAFYNVKQPQQTPTQPTIPSVSA